jgi:hypothetical protein
MATLVLGWPLLVPVDANAARCPKADREACRECFDSVLVDGVPDVRGGDGCAAAEGLVTGRQTRIQQANVALGVCKAQAPQDAGTCSRIFRWLNRCLREREQEVRDAWGLFKRRARARCGRRALALAERERRACLRDQACSCPVPVSSVVSGTPWQETTTTTTTTSTTTTTAASGTTTTTTTTTTTIPFDPNGSLCQRQCIKRVARNCYRSCRQSCDGSQEALAICQRGCRNRQCTDLRAVCAPSEDTDFDSNNPGRLNQEYFVCCKGPRGDGACDFDDPEAIACVSTTTSTTSTTESSTTTISTTTTLFSTTTTITVPGGV